MTDIKLALEIDDENPTIGDIFHYRGAATRTTDDLEATAQRIKIRFQFIKGEYFGDETQGIPWIGETGILGNKTDPIVLQFVARDVLLSTPGVVAIDELTVDFDPTTRTASVQFRAVLESGRIITSADFGPFRLGDIL